MRIFCTVSVLPSAAYLILKTFQIFRYKDKMFWHLHRNNSEPDKTGEAQGFQPDPDFKLKCLHLTHNHLTMFRICQICDILNIKPQYLIKSSRCFILEHTLLHKSQLTSLNSMPVLLNLVEIKACPLIMPLLINGDVPALLRLYL